jgi:hypothetical protein
MHFRSAIIVYLLVGGPASALAQPSMISWQGFLTDTTGQVVNGTVDLSFGLYEVSEGGSTVWTMDTLGISVSDGIVSLPLGPFDSLDFGKPHWLGVTIDAGTEISPRSPLNSAPSALTLLAPATITGNVTDSENGVLAVSNTATTGVGIAVSAETTADSGMALLGTATATSGRNYGVRGESFSPTGRGVLGRANAQTGQTRGVMGWSRADEGVGVFGLASSDTGQNIGVRGITNSPDGYSGYFTGGSGVYVDTTLTAGGVHATSDGVMFPDSTVQTSAAGFGLSVIAAGTVDDIGPGPDYTISFSQSTGNVSGMWNAGTTDLEITIDGVYFNHLDYFTQVSLHGQAGGGAPVQAVVGSTVGKLVIRLLDTSGTFVGFVDFSFVVFGN